MQVCHGTGFICRSLRYVFDADCPNLLKHTLQCTFLHGIVTQLFQKGKEKKELFNV